MLVGAVVGATLTLLFLRFVVEPYVDLKHPDLLVPISAGLVYVLTGLSIAVGVAAPRAGAQFLNVEDADELREESGKLRPAALVMVLTGAFLMILALSGREGLISTETGLVAALACLAGLVISGWVSAKRYDELTRRLGMEVSSLTLQIGMIAIAAWAAVAHLGFAAWVSPLALVSGYALLQLFISFVVIGRRGMLKPR
jgi:hypothetical protein